MNKKMRQKLLASVATGVTFAMYWSVPADVFAAEQEVTEDLGEVVVTATRSQKKDVDVPAATEIITAEEIKDSGAQTAGEALSKVDGIAYGAFGPNGAAMGTMDNSVNIRGIDNGTLVLVNGNPISWRGKYDLSAIPADSIERIEVVKGSGSVLYGSEAMAGVVNIITKKGAANTVTAGIGSSGQHHYAANVGDDRLAVHYNFNEWRHGVDVSKTATKFGSTRTTVTDAKKQSAGISYQLDDHLSLLYDYLETESKFSRYAEAVNAGSTIAAGDLFNNRKYTTQRHITQLNYKDKKVKAGVYFNTGTVESKGVTNFKDTATGDKETKSPRYNTREKNITYGADVQRRWTLSPKTKWILGGSVQREQYDKLLAYSTKAAAQYARNNFGMFSQLEQAFDAKNTGIVGVRETWTSGAWKDKNYHNFSASGQWLHKMDKANNLYVNVSQSFIMPTFAQMYGSSEKAIPNYNLKPQKGVNYELGWKQNHGAHKWKAALFHMDIKDNINASWKSTKSEYEYTNEDFKNTGVELSWDIKDAKPLSYHWGVTVQNPESKSSKKGYWDRKYGRVQLTTGITYKKDKWASNLKASYLCKRVQTPSSEHSFDAKPYLLTTWNTTYEPDKANELSLMIRNVLDRHDVISHSSSTYYGAPISYMFHYTYKF